MSLLRSRAYWLAPVLVALAAWELTWRLGLLNPALVSSPSQSVAALLDLLLTESPDGYPLLLVHVCSSLASFLAAFLLATFVGIGVGTAMGASPVVHRLLTPLITVTMPIPGIAWAPIFMVWTGFGTATIIAVSALAAFFPVAYNSATGVRSIDQSLVKAARTMGAARKDVLLQVCVPGATAHILTGIRLGFARGWRTAIAVEMIMASTTGLGFLVLEAREYLRPSLLYGSILLVGALYLLAEYLVIRRVERSTVEKWGVAAPALEHN